jgi:hypothetical protein
MSSSESWYAEIVYVMSVIRSWHTEFVCVNVTGDLRSFEAIMLKICLCKCYMSYSKLACWNCLCKCYISFDEVVCVIVPWVIRSWHTEFVCVNVTGDRSSKLRGYYVEKLFMYMSYSKLACWNCLCKCFMSYSKLICWNCSCKCSSNRHVLKSVE